MKVYLYSFLCVDQFRFGVSCCASVGAWVRLGGFGDRLQLVRAWLIRIVVLWCVDVCCDLWWLIGFRVLWIAPGIFTLLWCLLRRFLVNFSGAFSVRFAGIYREGFERNLLAWGGTESICSWTYDADKFGGWGWDMWKGLERHLVSDLDEQFRR